jgi:type VI secretion system secreted protein Hcp
MAEMFLELTGIEGESLDDHYTKAIELFDWGWIVTNKLPEKRTAGDVATKLTVNDIVVKKFCDKASANLMRYCALGKNISRALIFCRKLEGEHHVVYLLVELRDVKISDVKLNVGPGGGIHEEVSLNMAQFFVTYRLQNSAGHIKGDVGFGFDVPDNAEI